MTKTQQQNDMIDAFVASIPTMQTDIALLKQDTGILKTNAIDANKKSDMILDRLDKMAVVTPDQFELYRAKVEERFAKIEKYNNDTKPGVTFANALVSRWTTFLVLLILTAAVIVAGSHFVPLGK